MSDIQVVGIFVAIVAAFILWYMWGGGAAFLEDVPTYGDIGGGGN